MTRSWSLRQLITKTWGRVPQRDTAENCRMGSSSLKAELKALERLQIVRGRNFSYFRFEVESCTLRGKRSYCGDGLPKSVICIECSAQPVEPALHSRATPLLPSYQQLKRL